NTGVDVHAAENRRLALVRQVGARQRERRTGKQHRQEQRAERERTGDARLEPERTRAQAREPTTDCLLVHPWSLYPRPRTVATWRGLAGSDSIFVRNRRTCTSTSRPSPKYP